MAIRLPKSRWNFQCQADIPVYPDIHPFVSLVLFPFLFVFIRVIRGRILIPHF